jgi:hypothetical protein
MHIRATTRAELSTVASIHISAFAEDELENFIYPKLHQHLGDLYRVHLLRLRARLVEPGSHVFVFISDDEDDGWNDVE